MKYLKRFNEGLSDDFFLDLKDFCESHLAYLLDEDNFFLDYHKARIGFETTGVTHIELMIKGKRPFLWKDVRDYITPFILSLNKTYCLTETRSYFGDGKIYIKTTSSMGVKMVTYDIQRKDYQHYLTIRDIEKDNISPDTEIEFISIKVAGYQA